jgi:hypothetical protein
VNGLTNRRRHHSLRGRGVAASHAGTAKSSRLVPPFTDLTGNREDAWAMCTA